MNPPAEHEKPPACEKSRDVQMSAGAYMDDEHRSWMTSSIHGLRRDVDTGLDNLRKDLKETIETEAAARALGDQELRCVTIELYQDLKALQPKMNSAAAF